MWLDKENTNPLHPGLLLRALQARFSQFKGGHPCDVQEVILCIIDIFEKSLDKAWVESIFYGHQVQVVAWPKGKKASQPELFASLIVYPTKSDMTLDDLIRKHEEVNSLEGYIDDTGTTWPIAGTQTKISKEPKILMVTFRMYDEKKSVKLPEIFRGKYHLFAAAVHHGSTFGGHYTALVKHRGQWYHKDDVSVEEVNNFPESAPYYFCMYKS
jgi:ubiquitin C-terminal hydrolase